MTDVQREPHDATHAPDSITEHGGHSHAAHAGHAGHAEMFRRRFWWSLLLTVPVVVTSPMVMDWFGYKLDFTGIDWIGPVLGSVIFFWCGWVFLAGARAEIQQHQPGMMLLVAMAISVAYAASLATTIGWFDLEFWWELSALVTIMLLGHWLEMKALGQAQSALAALAELLPDEAERIDADNSITVVRTDALELGDVVLVRPGGRVPADGTIVEGSAEIDESMVTGESRPVAKGADDRVVAGTVATDSSVRVRVQAVGDDTALAGIQRLVAEAQSSQSRAQALADRFAALLFYVAAGAALLTFIVWTFAGDMDEAVVRTVTVLVIACPHALGLAIPLVISLSSALAAQAGILIKNRLALERMRTIDAVLFDKTGTLTKGEHVVTGIAGVNIGEDEVLQLAAAVEAESEHPLARAIVAAAAADTPTRGCRRLPLHHRPWRRGHRRRQSLRRRRTGTPPRASDLRAARTQRAPQTGGAVVGPQSCTSIRDDQVVGALALEDEIRPEARDAIEQLRKLGRRVIMITGDAHQVAEAVGRDLGVDEVMSEVLPEDKDAKVAALQARGLSVAMVGDGVNDAPALARADVGIAIGAGTDVAIESADVVLASNDPRGVISVIRLSVASYRKMVQNLAWAAGYNVIAIPLAAGAFAWAGITLGPEVGAVLMSLSTIVVALNAQLLRRVDLRVE